MNNIKYLTKKDLDFTSVDNFYKNLMLITSSVGKGKSTFVGHQLREILQKKTNKDINFILMLVPLNRIEDDFLQDNEYYIQAQKQDFQFYNKQDTRVRVMTIQRFGSWAQQEDIIFNLPDVVVIDEIHRSLLDNYYQELTLYAIHYLLEYWEQYISIGLTATPRFLKDYIENKFKYPIIDLTKDKEPVIISKKMRLIIGGSFQKFIPYLFKIDKNNKIVIYVENKKSVIKTVRLFREKGYKTEGIISIHNNDAEWEILGKTSLECRDLLVKTKQLNCDILVINKACLEGITIKDKNVSTMFIQATDITTIEQAYGRLRSCANEVYIFANNAHRSIYDKQIEICRDFLNKKWTQEGLKNYYKTQDDSLLLVYKYKDKYYINYLAAIAIDYNANVYASINNKDEIELYYNNIKLKTNVYDYYSDLAKYSKDYKIVWGKQYFCDFTAEQGIKSWREIKPYMREILINEKWKDFIVNTMNIQRIEKHGDSFYYVQAGWTTCKKVIKEKEGDEFKRTSRMINGNKVYGWVLKEKKA